MGFAYRRWLACIVFVTALSAFGFAASSDRTQFGHDITVASNENVSDATCFGCTIRVRGHVTGDVTTFGGSIIVEEQGEIGGDTTSFGGDLRLDSGSSVRDVTVFGGKVRRDPSATVRGDVTNFGGSYWLVLIFGLPFLFLGAFIALIIWIVRRLTRPAMPLAA